MTVFKIGVDTVFELANFIVEHFCLEFECSSYCKQNHSRIQWVVDNLLGPPVNGGDL